ncbi:MAG: glycosyltransferase WbuB, partial [Acidobacteriota bacterium]|nr:glycosyltransferase WbuB [Acidobacteriota bacterium]
MKVTLLNQYYAPDEAATAQILSDVGATLARAGHDVHAVCSDRAYAWPSRRYPRREIIDGVHVRRTRTTGFGRGSRLGRVIDYATFLTGAVAAVLFRKRPDVMLCLSTPPMMAAA